MALQFSIEHLIEYTDWERSQWRQLLPPDALKLGVGSNGDGRMQSVGDLILHIFSTEARYLDRLSGREITDPSRIAADNIEALFEFGDGSRRRLKEFITTFPAERWNEEIALNLMGRAVRVTPNKVIVHVLIHEMRHWPQVAMVLRWNGIIADVRDFIFSPVMSEDIRRQTSD